MGGDDRANVETCARACAANIDKMTAIPKESSAAEAKDIEFGERSSIKACRLQSKLHLSSIAIDLLSYLTIKSFRLGQSLVDLNITTRQPRERQNMSCFHSSSFSFFDVRRARQEVSS